MVESLYYAMFGIGFCGGFLFGLYFLDRFYREVIKRAVEQYKKELKNAKIT